MICKILGEFIDKIRLRKIRTFEIYFFKNLEYQQPKPV